MAYTDFTARELTTKFNVKFKAEPLFSDLKLIEPSSWLNETLTKGRNAGFRSEKSRSERLVSPILLELSERNKNKFTIYSGEILDADNTKGLNGECDFILSHSGIIEFVTAPIFCITEAKKQDLEKGIIQCAAQLIGANVFNSNEDKPVKTIYGCSTTGVEWVFLKLSDGVITLDRSRFYITELPKLLGVLQRIIDLTEVKS
jgi:hypothetical protein